MVINGWSSLDDPHARPGILLDVAVTGTVRCKGGFRFVLVFWRWGGKLNFVGAASARRCLLLPVKSKQLSSKYTEQSLVNFVGVKPLRRKFTNQSRCCLGNLVTSGNLKHNCKQILFTLSARPSYHWTEMTYCCGIHIWAIYRHLLVENAVP